MKRREQNEYARLNAVVLGLVMLILLGLIGVTYQLSRERIENNQLQTTQSLLQNLLPASYDNDPLSDRVDWTTDEFFNRHQHFTIYRARRQGAPAGVVLMPVVTTGYNGRIELIIGIDANERITGVRVLSQHETEGLGAGIDQSESGWIHQFKETSLENPPPGDWQLAGEGGAFDGLSGATVSPRAVIAAVHHALEFYQAKKQNLYD